LVLCRELSLLYHLAELLSYKAELAFVLGNFEEATTLAREARTITYTTRYEKVRLRCQVIMTKIKANTSKHEAIQIFRKMLRTRLSMEDRADIHFELFFLTRKQFYRTKALQHYLKLSKKTPKVHYRSRMDKLRKYREPDRTS
jgi:hypothetical protein